MASRWVSLFRWTRATVRKLCTVLGIGALAFCPVGWAGCAGCGGAGGDTCAVQQGPTGIDGGLTCGLPFELNETDTGGNIVGPGVFGVKVVEYVHVNAAGIVETDTISVLLVLAYVDYRAASLDADVGIQLCQIQVPKVDIPGQPKPTEFRTLPQMLPNIPRVTIRAWVSGNVTCETFDSEPAVTVIGACLEDDFNDELPISPSCSGAFDSSQKDTYCDTRAGCIYDLDTDGYPATTLEAENVPGLDVDLVFATMRSWVSMNGFVASSDLILGTANFDLAVRPFACRLIPLGGGAQRDCNAEEVNIVAKINPDITQTPGQDSTFMAVRVRTDMTCEELIDRELEIFGR